MPVRAVSEGPTKFLRVVCKKCFFELEYTPIDVRSNTYTDYGGGSDTQYSIRCPREVCQNLVVVQDPAVEVRTRTDGFRL